MSDAPDDVLSTMVSTFSASCSALLVLYRGCVEAGHDGENKNCLVCISMNVVQEKMLEHGINLRTGELPQWLRETKPALPPIEAYYPAGETPSDIRSTLHSKHEST